VTGWESWAPPLSPPTEGGLDRDEAQAIAGAVWVDGGELAMHECAALQWTSYAATLPPAPAVSAVTTGAQSVVYGQPIPGGELGLAIGRANWHRSFLSGQLVSVPLQVG
jgi:hypothetical protein